MDKSKSHIWPENYKFAVGLSHDVDEIKKTYQYLTHFFKSFRPYHFTSLFSKKEPYWNFEKIIALEDKCKVKSTFFFLHETKKVSLFHPKEIPIALGKCSFSEKKIREIIITLQKGGWEIGLHGSYESYLNKELMQKEKRLLEEILNKPVMGIRQHYLMLKIPRTWEIQKDLGFKYDASFGSNKTIGFPADTFFPFRPFNDYFLVFPLTVMDYVLFKTDRTPEKIWKRCRNLILDAEKKNALLIILWHQRTFNEEEFPGAGKIYENIIKLSIDKGGWVTNLGEIFRWWNRGEGEENVTQRNHP